MFLTGASIQSVYSKTYLSLLINYTVVWLILRLYQLQRPHCLAVLVWLEVQNALISSPPANYLTSLLKGPEKDLERFLFSALSCRGAPEFAENFYYVDFTLLGSLPKLD